MKDVEEENDAAEKARYGGRGKKKKKKTTTKRKRKGKRRRGARGESNPTHQPDQGVLVRDALMTAGA